MCFVNVCPEVRKSVLLSVSIKVFYVSPTDVVNVTNLLHYQQFNSTHNGNKSILGALAVSFLLV